MLEADIQMLPLITEYQDCKLHWPAPGEHYKLAMDVQWDGYQSKLTLKATKSDAEATIRLVRGEWKVWTNHTFSFIHEALDMTLSEFIKHVLTSYIRAVKPVTPDEPVSCRSYDGVTQGLIDSIICMARVLRHRELTNPIVQEALKDLHQDEDIRHLLDAAAKA